MSVRIAKARFKVFIRPLYRWWQALNIRLSSVSRIFKIIFYIFDRNFLSDYHAFVVGAVKYEQMSDDKSVISLLRRNCHRIEKGFVHPKRRPAFALDFINETIDAFEYVTVRMGGTSTAMWSARVLDCYFDIVQSDDARFVSAANRYNRIKRRVTSSERITGLPYRPLLDTQAMYTLRNIIESRKSVRRFEPVAVDASVTRIALEAAIAAPSSCNRQSFRYIVTHDKALAAKIAAVSAGTAGWRDQIPAVALVVADYAGFRWSANRHGPFIDATLSVMPFVLSLEAAGLSSCLINWADSPTTRRNIGKLVQLSESEKVVMTIAFGLAQSGQLVPSSARKTVEEICTYV